VRERPKTFREIGMDVCYLTATEMARLLRRKELSAREVLEAHLRQIERLNPQINAIVTLVEGKARKRAAELDEEAAHGRFAGPLHGLPIAHKDLLETKGIRTTFGSPILRDYVPVRNELIVERAQQAGAVTIGKTNTPEFGAGSQTFNTIFGATRNPWDLSKTSGGSSGGAAAALACGMVPIADGTDVGGSLRNPASFCSVVGFRPTPGRVPSFTAGWNPLGVVGPMARTVEDTALFLGAIAGPHPEAPLSIYERGSVFAESIHGQPEGLRIAWCAAPGGLRFDRRVRAVFDGQRTKFEAIGCQVEDVEPDFSGADESFRVFRALLFYQGLNSLVSGHYDRVKETVMQEIGRGAQLTGPEIAAAETQRSELFARFGRFMHDYNFLVLPTAQVPAFDVAQEYPSEIDGTTMRSYIDWMGSCYFLTMTGLPAISVPAGFTPDGLPVGLQIVGHNQDDLGVLQLARLFEQVIGISGRFPSICGC
jgi:amidase